MSDVFRNGRVHVQRHECSTCIFRPGNLMDLNEGRVEQMVADCLAGQGVIPCHKNLTGEGQAICRGFFNAHGKAIAALRFAQRLGMIEEVVLREQ